MSIALHIEIITRACITKNIKKCIDIHVKTHLHLSNYCLCKQYVYHGFIVCTLAVLFNVTLRNRNQ